MGPGPAAGKDQGVYSRQIGGKMIVYENTISGVLRNPENYYFDRHNDAYVARNDDAAWFAGHDVRALAEKLGLELRLR
jgi:hypothetical protein